MSNEKMPTNENAPTTATVLSRREIHRGRKILVTEQSVQLPTGVTTTLDLIEHPGASAVVSFDAEGRVAILRQFRFAASGDLWEIPAGTLDDDEDPATCARRELIEEAGVSATRWDALGHIFTAPGFTDEKIFLYLARDLSPAAQALDFDEVIHEVRHLPLEEALAWVADVRISDAKSIAALCRADAFLRAEAGTTK